jgi:uncharacterized protein (DUF488 family)
MRKGNIYTIGHSTYSLQEFIAMLKSFQIELLADIRNFPGSKRFPHFNKEALSASLAENAIDYIHLKDLGGRRKPRIDSHNTGWRVEAFRGYADYMETDPFIQAIKKLESLGEEKRVTYMCSEAVWWRCHRALVSDYLKHKGWIVVHIMGKDKGEEHPYTSPARIVNNQLVYRKDELF